MTIQLLIKSILISIIASLFFSCGGNGDKNNDGQNGLDNRVLLTAKEALVLAEPLRSTELHDGKLCFIMVLFDKNDQSRGKQYDWSIFFIDPQTNSAIEVNFDSKNQHIFSRQPFSLMSVPPGLIPEEWVDSENAMEAVLSNGGDSENLENCSFTLSGTLEYPINDPIYYAWIANYYNIDASIVHNYYVGVDGKFLGKEFYP